MRGEPIDFVITWVDGSDPAWKAEKERYLPDGQSDAGDERYRDWGLLKYWFRGVEKFTPWVRRVHLVTWGHVPGWLRKNHRKLHIVRHDDFIPEEYLPTFNCNVIELHLDRIQGLSSHFVYFNDDIFLIRKQSPKEYFYNGKPCDMLAFQPVVANPSNPVMSHLLLNNSLVLCKYFQKRENVRRQPWNYFKPGYPPLYFFYNMLELFFPLYTGFYTVHGPSSFCRETFRDVWEKEGEALAEMSGHRFRHKDDLTVYLVREWQKLNGNFHACNMHRNFRYFDVSNDNSQVLSAIRKQQVSTICVNDTGSPIDFERVRDEIEQALFDILPEKSSFEKQ